MIVKNRLRASRLKKSCQRRSRSIQHRRRSRLQEQRVGFGQGVGDTSQYLHYIKASGDHHGAEVAVVQGRRAPATGGLCFVDPILSRHPNFHPVGYVAQGGKVQHAFPGPLCLRLMPQVTSCNDVAALLVFSPCHAGPARRMCASGRSSRLS